MSAAPAFRLTGVTKSFPVGETLVPILRGLNLEIARGEYVAIMGPSGSGKSTLMHLLGCLDLPTEGTLEVSGRDVAQISDDELAALRARTIGFVFQRFHLLPNYTSLSNVSLSMVYTGLQDRVNRSQWLLEQLGLGHRLYARPRTLSGGEQQRVAIARALANDPSVILADEPTGALDQTNGRAILDLFDGFYRQGRTVILVTHDPHVAARARRVVEMMDGRIESDRRTGGAI